MTTAYLNRWCLLALSIGVSSFTTVRAQTLPIAQAPQSVEHQGGQPPLCDPDLIDTTFAFASLPAGEQTVSLHFQNKSSTACRLHGEPSPSFAVDSHSMYVESCWLCDQNHRRPLAPEREPGNQILLAPAERAALDLHWASTGESCQWADWVNFFVRWTTDRDYGYLFIPSDWPMHICSAVKSAGYRVEAASSSTGQMSGALLRISVAEAPVYSDEHATLHVELSGQTPSVEQQDGCATLYSLRQGPSIGTRLDPLRTVGTRVHFGGIARMMARKRTEVAE